ncbi:unnamed protein product, partial [Symbiodinium sp. CCMP2592]
MFRVLNGVFLPSGTTSNERLHHEINHWIRETAALRKATSVMKLDFFQSVKVFTHNQALYRPLQRQASQAEMTRRALKANVQVILPRPAWRAWCKELTVPGSAPKRAQLQVLKQGRAVREAMRQRKAE